MKPEEVFVIVFAVLLLFLLIYFVTAKGEKKRITITNADGASVNVDVEIANNTTTRAKGLMGRSSLPENEGMLFIFERPDIYGFWMLNTTIPLDAVFFDENGTAVDVITMEPCGLNPLNCRSYAPALKSQYVLEVNAGFAEKNKVKNGSKLKLPV